MPTKKPSKRDIGSSWSISNDARLLASSFMDVADADGVVDEGLYDAWMAALDGVSGDIEEKLRRLREVRDRVAAEAGVLKAQAERISARSKRRFAEVDRLKGYMKELLLAHRELHPEVNKVDLDDGFIRLTKRTSYEVTLVEEGVWPTEYVTRGVPKLNKALIVTAHKEGVRVPGVKVEKVMTEHIMEGK